jgi:5-methylthioadenosine/S-adenosylhomocysteine deaminase
VVTGTEGPLRVRARRCVLGGVREPLRVRPAELEIEAGTIVRVREEDPATPDSGAPQGGRSLDLGDRLVTPAFVNGHTHLAMAAFRGVAGLAALRGNVVEDLFFRLEQELTAAEVRAFARLGAYESLLAGVGTVFDHYYQGEALAEALADVGLTGVIAPTLQDLAGPGSGDPEGALAATEAIDDSARLRAAGVVAALGPHATDTVSGDYWRRAVTIATSRHLPVHAHLAQSHAELERAAARHGATPLEWLAREGILDSDARLLLVHGIFVTERDLERLTPQRHTLGFCPYSQMEFCFPAALARWDRAGLPWLVATDCAASNDSMDVQKELRLVSGLGLAAATFSSAAATFAASAGTVVQASELERSRTTAFDDWRPLRSATALLASVWSVPGRLHPTLPVGAIETGRLANLLVLDPNHPALWPAHDPLRALVMSDVAPAIEWMMLRGEFVGCRNDFHRSVLADGYADAREEATARLTQRLARLGLVADATAPSSSAPGAG